jgi:hypothetical protein
MYIIRNTHFSKTRRGACSLAAIAALLFVASPAPAQAATARVCAVSVHVTHPLSLVNAIINRSCGEKVRAWGYWTGQGTIDGPWKTSGTSVAFYNGYYAAHGGYQRMQANGTVHTVTTF